ncbi:MAG: DUF1161 domain-containing protein [Acidobacteriia bacterium]|nr:DUF1161 domain-containing protein [Terriglobia bacterium]
MKTLATIGALLFVAAAANAQGIKPCEELKTEIAAKLDAKGVKPYTLEIVAKDKDSDGKVVGTCEGGSKKIVYSKTATAAPETEKPKS